MTANRAVSACAPVSEKLVRMRNPRRVWAGRLNRQKWPGITAEGRQRLRASCLKNAPWKSSTGPRTVEGKARSAANARVLQKGPMSVRQRRAEIAEFLGLAGLLRRTRRDLGDLITTGN
jgi:hypothetical protein